MKCPLLESAYYSNNQNLGGASRECLKEECAWWDDIEEHCSVLMGMKLLARLTGTVAKLEDKMPRGNQ